MSLMPSLNFIEPSSNNACTIVVALD